MLVTLRVGLGVILQDSLEVRRQLSISRGQFFKGRALGLARGCFANCDAMLGVDIEFIDVKLDVLHGRYTDFSQNRCS